MDYKASTIQISNAKKYLKLLFVAILLIVFLLILNSDALFSELEFYLQKTSVFIQKNPKVGMLVFLLLAAFSAMFAFFSSAILVPIGVYTWGPVICFLLLWVGWCLGGLLAYLLGYYAGREVITYFVAKEKISQFEKQLSKKVRFIHILGFQALLPSEVPGYVLGALRYRIDYYLYALAIVEIPYAIATISIGESFLQRDLVKVLSTLAIIILCMAGAYKFLVKKNLLNKSQE